MSTEINTRGGIRSKISSFPSGNDSECLSKQEIQSAGGSTLEISGSYGNAECVVLDNIGAVTWEYTLSASVSSLSFAGAGGTKSFTVTSTKQKKVNGVNSGSPVSVGYSNSVSGSGFSISGNSVTAKNNASSSSRSGTVTVTQGESGKKVTVSLSQDAGAVINRITLRPVGNIIYFNAQYRIESNLDVWVDVYTEDKMYPQFVFPIPSGVYSGEQDISYIIPEPIERLSITDFQPRKDSEYEYYLTSLQ